MSPANGGRSPLSPASGNGPTPPLTSTLHIQKLILTQQFLDKKYTLLRYFLNAYLTTKKNSTQIIKSQRTIEANNKCVQFRRDMSHSG